jgi:hypothetical protein
MPLTTAKYMFPADFRPFCSQFCELWPGFMRCFGLLGDTSKNLTHTRLETTLRFAGSLSVMVAAQTAT